MTRKERRLEYEEYQKTMREFFSRGLANLSITEDEHGSTEAYFSWQPCGCCRRQIGGNRYHCSGWNNTTQEVEEYEVCQDCVYYAEYGQLDDSTMIEME